MNDKARFGQFVFVYISRLGTPGNVQLTNQTSIRHLNAFLLTNEKQVPNSLKMWASCLSEEG